MSNTLEEEDLIVDVIYSRIDDDGKLNDSLDKLCERFNGKLVTVTKDEENTIRQYIFLDKQSGDFFLEDANMLISRYFTIEPSSLEETFSCLWFEPSRGIYHSFEFENKEGAQRFASSVRGVFSTFLHPEDWDIHIVEPVDDETGYIVLWGMSIDSVMLSPDVFQDLDEEVYLKPPTKKKETLN